MSTSTQGDLAVDATDAQVLLEVDDVVKHFPVRSGALIDRTHAQVRAVDGVSFSLKVGETLGLVGESGCGKSTLARLITALHPVTSGHVRFRGQDITALNRRQMRPIRKSVQMVFQDPYGSLNPRRRVGSSLSDPFSVHERQRIGIARALALRPDLIVCDEPVSALDVSIQAQIINLLEDLQDEFMLTYVFIAHDLSVVRHVSDRIAVMYLGKLVETGPVEEIYSNSRHPYTASLLSAVPVADQAFRTARRERVILTGDVPSPVNPPSGCRFHPRCPKAQAICATEEPPLEHKTGDPIGHLTACHFPVNPGETLANASRDAVPAPEAAVGATEGVDQ